ncbi:hypothetical protein D7V97_00070 [Corallococcus sp. CA053C]|nr:hypothetical protein D7V97_00070 [Corallococcus sp. CA053C]
MPAPSSNRVLVFFFGVDGNMYLLSHNKCADPVVTILHEYPGPDKPTPISKHKNEVDQNPPLLIDRLPNEAAYVTCYLLDLQSLQRDDDK